LDRNPHFLPEMLRFLLQNVDFFTQKAQIFKADAYLILKMPYLDKNAFI
jgi:hypothetical protein